MSVLIERASRAQVLPRRDDQQFQTVTAWAAESCCSADQRNKHETYRDLAASLEVRSGELASGEARQ